MLNLKFEKLRARVLDAKIVFKGNVESGNKPERKAWSAVEILLLQK